MTDEASSEGEVDQERTPPDPFSILNHFKPSLRISVDLDDGEVMHVGADEHNLWALQEHWMPGHEDVGVETNIAFSASQPRLIRAFADALRVLASHLERAEEARQAEQERRDGQLR